MRLRIDFNTFSYRMAKNNYPFTTMILRTAQEAAQYLIGAGFSQAAIATRAGVKQPTISRILSGELKDPAGSILVKLNEFADEVAKAAVPLESQPQ